MNEEITSMKIKKSTIKKLSKIKINLSLKSYEDVILFLIGGLENEKKKRKN